FPPNASPEHTTPNPSGSVMIDRGIHCRNQVLSLVLRGNALAVLLLIGSILGGSQLVAEEKATAPAKQSPDERIDFERDVQPVLTRYGCNSGACHGKQRGQNGFQLSLLGF